MKHKIITFLSFLVVFIGIGTLMYPMVSDYVNSKVQENALSNYKTTITKLDYKNLEGVYKKAKEYNDNLLGLPVHDPFSRGQGYVVSKDYNNVLNPNGDGIMGSLEIPSIGVDLPIYHGCAEETLAKGVGHIEGTSLPVGGKGTKAILSGHRGLPSATLFTYLPDVKKGDEFYIHVLGKTLAYKVYKEETILPNKLGNARPEAGRDEVILVTCTPYGVNTHRFLVYGERVPYSPKVEKAMAAKNLYTHIDYKYILFGVSVGFLIIVIAILIRGRIKKKTK